jgi:CheY-like chemotaxis protein
MAGGDSDSDAVRRDRSEHVAKERVKKLEALLRHIVFLDLGMPAIDGYELAVMIRRSFNSEEVKLVAVTGYGREQDRARSRRAGFDAHVLKPMDPALVESILKTIFLQGR